jgi:hypothetical protein
MLIDLFADKNAVKKEDKALVEEIKKVSADMNNAYKKFNESTDSYEIESIIYHIKELEMKYTFLIKKAKLEKICDTELRGGLWHLK